MASQHLATSQNIPNRINRKVQHGSNLFKHHQSSNIFTTCSPYHCRKLSKIYCKAQRHENPGEQEDHCTRLCQERYNESTRPPQRIALFRFLGTLKSSPKEEWRTVRVSHYQKSAEIIRDSSIEKGETERNRTGEGHISDNQAWFRGRFRQVRVSQRLQVDSGILRHAPATC